MGAAVLERRALRMQGRRSSAMRMTV